MPPFVVLPLVYFAFAAFVLWIAGRFLRPLSLGTAVILALLPLAFTGPALLTGRVYAPLDLHYQAEPLSAHRETVGLADDERSRTRFDVALIMIPWQKATRHAIGQGEWPLWNPFMLCGDVLAASGQPAVYHPIHAITYLLPFGPSLTFAATAVLFVAGLCAFSFHREIGCRESAAIVGAAGWAFCGFILFWLGWPLVLTVVFFPLVLLAVRRVAHAPGLRSAVLLTVAFVLVLLAGHPETAFHAVMVGLAYGVFELVRARGTSRLAPVGWSLLAGLVAILLTAIDVLPFLEAMPQTVLHTHRQATDAAQSVPWGLALERLRVVLVPFVYGVPTSEWIVGPSKFGAHWYAYTGSVLLAPAALGLWRGRWPGRWFLLGMLIAGILVFVAAPGLIDLLALLPGFDLAINRRLTFVTGFALASLAALGVEAWAAEGPGRPLGWLSLGALGVIGLAIAAFWPGMREAGLSTGFLTSRTLLELVPMALVATLFLLVRAPRLAVAGLLVVLVAQRLLQTGDLNPTHPADLLAPPIAAFNDLPAGEEPFRIVGQRQLLTPNLATLYELEDVRGVTAMTNLRLYRTYPLWSARPKGLPRVEDLARPFLSFLNVRFAVVSSSEPPPPGWRVFRSTRRFAIHENRRALARAFVPRGVRFVAPGDRVWDEMKEAGSFSATAWIETSDPALPASGRLLNGPGQVTVERQGLGFRLEAAMEQPGWVVVSETAWQGWQATSGGRKLPLHFANHAFLAFELPAGQHSVDLVYRPRSFVVGRALSFSTAGVIAVVWLVAALRATASARSARNGSETVS